MPILTSQCWRECSIAAAEATKRNGRERRAACQSGTAVSPRSTPVADADFYFCGPKGFMRMLALGLRAIDVPEQRIHFEFFGPAQALYA